MYEAKEVIVMRINVLTVDGKADGSPLEDLRGIKPVHWDGRSTSGFSKG
jgi:hypothetical protein